MKIRTILAGTAVATLALFAGAGMPPGLSVVTQAEAAVSISFSVFYDELEPHGDWVRYRNSYVFIPSIRDADWRPYTRGRWVHTARYGWMWASDEPFGWATYHYGRWGYGEDIGWYWVPGRKWAPAWVSWRRGGDHIVWAPLPPSRDSGDIDVSISISVGDIPDYYWVAVPARRFLAPDIHVVVVEDEPEIRRVIQRTEWLGAPRITNNIVVNNVIDVDVVVEATGEQVQTVKLRQADNPREAQVSGDQVTVFQADVEAEADARPSEVRDVGEVQKVRRRGDEGEAAGAEPAEGQPAQDQAGEQPEEQPAQDQAGEQPDGQPSQNQAGEQPEKQPAQDQAGEQPDGQPAQDQAGEQPDGQPAQDQAGEQPAQQRGQDQAEEQPEQPPAQEQAEERPDEAPAQDQAGEKPAQQRGQEQAEEQPGQGQGQGREKPARQQAEEQPEQPDDEATGTTTQPEPPPAAAPREEEAQGQGNRGQGQGQGRGRECDPATDPNCEPAQ